LILLKNPLDLVASAVELDHLPTSLAARLTSGNPRRPDIVRAVAFVG
jgi:hypothetical protein